MTTNVLCLIELLNRLGHGRFLRAIASIGAPGKFLGSLSKERYA